MCGKEFDFRKILQARENSKGSLVSERLNESKRVKEGKALPLA